jgi:hypothetical protein
LALAFGAVPAPGSWQAAVAAGIAAAPAAMPMKARRENRGGELMRTIMPETDGAKGPDRPPHRPARKILPSGA